MWLPSIALIVALLTVMTGSASPGAMVTAVVGLEAGVATAAVAVAVVVVVAALTDTAIDCVPSWPAWSQISMPMASLLPVEGAV